MNKDFSILVSKSLAGEADEREKALLREMLHDSDNYTLYNSIKEYWDADVKVDKNLSEETQKRILKNMPTHPQRHGNRRNPVLWFYRAAAVILLLFASGIYYYHHTQSVHYYTYASQDNITEYVLQDGTKVKLNKNSSVTFTSDFGQKERRIDLKGEAFFEVSRDKSKLFTVSTQGTETQVLGTKFNVQSDEQQKQVTVALVEGSVRFKADKCDDLLCPQEEISYHTATNEYIKQIADLQMSTAWREGRYHYEDIAFGELLKKLEQIYEIRIEMNYPEIETRKITASFRTDQPIRDILSALEDELKFSYNEINNKKITIEKK
ncbi:MAG: FecR domain-containing protein [Clostridiales bacterium]|jgi:ferric-dicitrate binding protein FerR (iron transport regulator)|nr:FecR domain-containing protein [Clostridiales bacterium]